MFCTANNNVYVSSTLYYSHVFYTHWLCRHVHLRLPAFTPFVELIAVSAYSLDLIVLSTRSVDLIALPAKDQLRSSQSITTNHILEKDKPEISCGKIDVFLLK